MSDNSAQPEENATPSEQASAPKSTAPGRGRVGGGRKRVTEQESGLKPYLPIDLIGGTIPYVPGTEDEAVWNAAAQACGTERVHFVFTVSENRCWYLACPSSTLSSAPDSWCPLAAALPGNSEFWDTETIYLYEQEGMAGALRWDPDTGRMQVFLGASRTILPRIQSLDANFVTINADVAKPARWKNRAMFQEQLSRWAARFLLMSGIGVTMVAFMILAGSYVMANVISPKLDEARKVTTQATNQLLIDATNALHSDANKHFVRIIDLFNTIGSFGGVLVKYEVTKDGKIEWEALIPSAVAPGQLNAKALGAEDGRVRIRGTR